MSTTIASMGEGRTPGPKPISARPVAKEANPIAYWLQRFARRQARLQVARGLGVALTSVLVGAACILGLDALGWIDDAARWVLSTANYAIALVMGSSFGLSRLWRAPNRAQLASCAEKEASELGESLLSCVELQDIAPEHRHFSPQFLDALEVQVAQKLEGLRPSQLLPWKHARRPVILAVLGVAAMAVPCLWPSLEMPQRLARAFLPWVELSRPTRTKIVVRAPSRETATVPEHQRIAFEIELAGDSSDTAYLELKSNGGVGKPSFERVEMKLVQRSPAIFACTAPVAAQSLQYRFLAGDAKTPYRQLRVTPRPRVLQFHPKISFPEYTKLGTQERTLDRGGLTMLSNSGLEVRIEPSMPLRSASLLVDSLDASEKVMLPLTYDAAKGWWVGNWNMSGDAKYQVKMVADVPDAEQSIENTYSPFHEVDTVTDHTPSVGWVTDSKTYWDRTPTANRGWMVVPEQIVPMAASLADDLPGATLEQEISINRQPWVRVGEELTTVAWGEESTALASEWIAWPALDGVDQPTRGTAHWNWDVLTSGAVSGDVVSVRVVAKDSLGQRTVSPALQFSIAAPGFDRNRHEALYQKASLAGPMKELAEWMKLQKAELRPKLSALKERSTSMATRRETASEIERFVMEWKRRGEGLRQQARSVVGTLPRFLDQSELEFVHRVLAKWERENLSAIELVSKSDAWDGLGDQDQPPPLLLERLLPQLQQQVDFAVSSMDVLESGATQLNDQFRQLLGHDCLTALTKDLLYLWSHQKETVARAEKMDFAMLARSQTIAEQIIDAVAEVGERIEPSVSNHLRDQLKNLYRFLDQTRNELKDLAQVEGTSQAYQNLLQRIQRSASDLQGQHWAFNLDGGLWWSVADTRRQLIQSGHGIGQAMDRVVMSGIRTAEWMRDGRLDSDVLQKLRSAMADEMAMSHLPATSAMIDRRDFHLRRQPTDPMFPGDMGLAHRAWRGQMEAWWEQQPGSPVWSETLTSLQAIAKAYRVLEVAHEIHDIRGTLEALKRQEQYDWESLEGKLSHLKQWESVNHRSDMAHHWMREAGFPNPIPDKLNALRWTAKANEIRQSLEPRRNVGNTQLLSAAEALQQHLEEWTQVQQLAQPTIDDARRFLAKYAPSVSELAKQAAAKTRVLQQQTESLVASSDNRQEAKPAESSEAASQEPSKNPESPASESAATESAVADATSPNEKVDASPQSIATQQRQVERSIAQLQEALLDAALSQDILDAKQLQIAKDSDRALDLIDRVHEPMLSAQAALAEAQRNSKSASDVGEAAKEASERQERAAEAMEVIANHFANIEQSAAEADAQREAALEQSRQALAQQQRSMESESQASDPMAASESPSAEKKESDPLESYSKADQLNEMARNSPDALLKQLEAELRRNRPMQKELSSISKSNVADSVSQLNDAAKREANIAQNLENSDSAMTEAKEIQVQQLKALADSADRMAADLLNKGTQAIQRMNQPESVRALQRSAEQLRQSANQARYTDARATQEALKEKTQALNESVQKAQQQLSEIAPRVQQLVDQNTFKEDKQRQSQLTEMQSWQSLMRDDLVRRAKDIAREREQNVERLRKESEQRQKEQEQKARERQQAIDQANAQPQNEGLKGQIDQKTKELSQATQRADSAKRLAESAQGLAKQSQEQMQRIEQAARANLDAPNPLAALGREQLSAAKEQLDQLQSALQGLQGQTAQPTDRSPSADALAASQPQQKGVQASIEEVSEQLSRSARHEERLGNDVASQRLNEQSKQVVDQVQPAVDRAADMLEQSASNTRSSESEQAKQARGESSPKPMRSPSSEGTLQGLKQAEEALQRQAQELQSAFGGSTGERSAQSGASQSSPSQPSPSQAASAQSSQGSPGAAEATPSDSPRDEASNDPIPSAKQLARMLDALDRQLNSGAEAATQSPKASPQGEANAQSSAEDNRPSDGNGARQENAKQDDSAGERNQGKGAKSSPGAVQDALRESAEQVASQLQNERLAKSQKSREKSSAPKRPSTQPGGQPTDDGNTRDQPTGNSNLPAAALGIGSDWGRLREKRADDVTEGRREIYDPEFSDAIRAYYRALARPRQP